jgi:hypothetical protein
LRGSHLPLTQALINSREQHLLQQKEQEDKIQQQLLQEQQEQQAPPQIDNGDNQVGCKFYL